VEKKMGKLSKQPIDSVFRTVKQVLWAMTEHDGRDTERDLFGRPGGYRTILSKQRVSTPCPLCGTVIRKASCLGGSIYICGGCQRL